MRALASCIPLMGLERADPLPINILLAMVGAALAAQKLRVAMLVLIVFHALLRTTEIIYIQASHFTFPQRYGPVLLVLPLTKSGQRLQNVPETETITDPLVLACVWAVIPRLQPGERLFHASAQAFRREFLNVVQLARLTAFRWHPYSLRRGGATTHDMEFGNLDRTMMRGRWVSFKPTRLYINSAVASAAEISAT